MKKFIGSLMIPALVSSLIGMEPDHHKNFLSLKNETSEPVEMVITNANQADKYIQIGSKKKYTDNNHLIADEMVLYFFRRNKTPKGKYEAGWSIPPKSKHIHLILDTGTNDTLHLNINPLKKPNINQNDIRRILPTQKKNNA